MQFSDPAPRVFSVFPWLTCYSARDAIQEVVYRLPGAG